MHAVADMDHKVRASRAYLAGFGTSGSLLAGAALMFVLASAVVGFHGWPQVASQTPVTNVAAPQVIVSPSSRASRILATLAARRAPAGTAAALTRTARSAGTGKAGSVTVASQTPVRGATTGSVGVAQTTCQGASCKPTVHAGANPTSVSGVTGPVSQAVSKAGSQAGSAVSGATNTASKVVAPVSPSAASTVRRLGQGAGQSVSGAANTVAKAISQVGGLAHLTH